jgi:hypothetical protein
MRRPLSPDDEALVVALATRKPSEALPILLETARRQSARRRPSDLLEQLSRDPFVAPSALDQRLTTRFDAAALEVADGFEALLLSPLTPLGTCAVVSPTTQDRSVTTPRSTEVVSDPTNVLALECARRLLAGKSHVRLCTIHQVVRPQRFEGSKGSSQHFRLFALAEAGAARAEHGFEVETVVSHAALFVRLFDACETLGCHVPKRRASLRVAAHAQALGDRVHERLSDLMPELPVDVSPLESGYYDGLRLVVGAESPSGQYSELGDIGVFDWIAKLTSNRRMRFVAAGLGIQRLASLFGDR